MSQVQTTTFKALPWEFSEPYNLTCCVSVEDIRCLACLVDREDSKASSVFRTAKRNMKEGKGRREEVEGDRGWSGYLPPFNASSDSKV